MTAYIIGFPEVLSPEPMIAYREGIEATLTPYGGRYRAMLRNRWESLEGQWPSQFGVVVLEFPSYEQAKAWYHSDAYAPLKAMRMAGDRWNHVLVEAMEEDETLLSLGILTLEEQARMEQRGATGSETDPTRA
jgi:uncharacterized protein (DUF1330 family)